MDTDISLEVSKISIKKLLIIIMLMTVLISITLFSIVSNRYVNEYFDDYMQSVYSTNLNNIIEFGSIALTIGKQQRVILNSYVVEPIYYAEIYDNDKNLVMSSGNMGNRFVIDEKTMNIEYYDITADENIIGQVAIVSAEKISYTNTKQVFIRAIYVGAVIAGILVIIFMGIIGTFIVRYISKDSNKVVKYATDEKVTDISSKITEFSQIINAIKGYKVKLATKERIKKEKFDRILHETKTPITVLKSQLEGAVDGIISIDKDRASDMTKIVDKLDYILKDATTIIEGNEIVENMEILIVDYSEHIIKIVNSLKTRFNKKGLDIIYNKKRFVINTDAHILDNAVYNLLTNSYKYTQKGSVTIETFDKELIIKDTGIGIAQDEIDKVFNPYFRGSDISNISGEGLGLYNVKNDLNRLGIDISIKSKLNEFTEFKLIFK